MSKVIGIGKQRYDRIIENDCFYIDKTMFIKEWWENQDDVTLITRPRRFGKTLNLSMVDYFFSNQHGDSGKLFEKLDIWKEEKGGDLESFACQRISESGEKSAGQKERTLSVWT